MNSRPQKFAAMFVVVALHAVGVTALFSIPQRPRHQDTEIVFMMIAPKTETKSPPRRVESRKASATSANKTPELSSNLNEPAALPLINWDQQREGVVSQIIREQSDKDASRSGMSTNADRASVEKEAPGIFEKPIQQRGDSQRLGDGEVITWINDRCYYTNRPAPGERLDTNAPTKVCKRGPASANGDLFEALKPRYLKKKDNEQDQDTGH